LQAKTRGVLPWLALAASASLLSALVPVGEALWSKVLTISGEVSIRPSEPPPDDGGGEGCSPGYWKNHKENWPDAFSAHDKAGEILWPDAPPDLTLLEALEQGGGGMNALLRQTVAALLNSTHPDIDYAYDTAAVISLFQGALADANLEDIKNPFEKANETGCPLPKDDNGDGEHDDDGGEPCSEEQDDFGYLDDGQVEGAEDLDGDRKEHNDCDPEEDDESNEDEGDEPCLEEGQESIGSPGQGEDGHGEDTGDCEQPQENDAGELRVEATATLEPTPSLTPTPTDTPTPEPTLVPTEILKEETEDSGD